jgi:hypothetical protein
MSGLEFMTRLSAIIAPPRYPLLRYAGALGPRSAWRKDIVPRPRERRPACNDDVSDMVASGAEGCPERRPTTYTERPIKQ